MEKNILIKLRSICGMNERDSGSDPKERNWIYLTCLLEPILSSLLCNITSQNITYSMVSA